MEIKKITYKSRNDFKAIFQCERCGNEFEAWGYSDDYYYNNVLPNALCPKCGTNSHGENADQLETRAGRLYVI